MGILMSHQDIRAAFPCCVCSAAAIPLTRAGNGQLNAEGTSTYWLGEKAVLVGLVFFQPHNCNCVGFRMALPNLMGEKILFKMYNNIILCLNNGIFGIRNLHF